MPVRELTQEEQTVMAPFRPPQPAVRELSGDEQIVFQREQRLEQAEEAPSFTDKAMRFVFNTDIDDPLEFERLGLIVSAGLAAGQIGARTPILPGPAGLAVNPVTGALAAGLAGVTAASVAPEATLELMESLGLAAPGTREERGLSNEELRRVAQGEALIEVATFGLGAGIRLGGRTIGRVASGIDESAEELAGQAAKEGVTLAPFQVGMRGFGKGVVNVLGRMPFIGGASVAAARLGEETFKKVLDDLPHRIGPLMASSELGVRLYAQARTLVKNVDTIFQRRYEDLFLEAARTGAVVQPAGVLEVASRTLKKIGERTPTKRVVEEVASPIVDKAGRPVRVTEEVTKQKQNAAAATELVRDFLNKEVVDIGEQSLAQADEILKKIDQAIGGAPKELRKEVNRLLSPVKGALKGDINNIGGELGKKLADLDADFSETMAFLFETSTAKKFTRVRRQGLRGMVRTSEKATQVPEDKLAKILLDMDSPQAIDELSRLMDKDTFRRVGARAMANILDESMTQLADGSVRMSADKLANGLGLIGRDTTRKEVVDRLLRDSPLTEKTVRTIVRAAAKLTDAPVPNVSTFLARSVTLRAGQGIIRALFAPLAVMGAGAAGGAGGVLFGLTFFLGMRGMVSAVSNPTSARALNTVLNEEASNFVRRGAFLQVLRIVTSGGKDATEAVGERLDLTRAEIKRMIPIAVQATAELFPKEKK